MKILIASALPPWHYGGVETIVRELATHLSLSHNVEVHVWSGAVRNTHAGFCNRVNVRTYRTSKWLGYASPKMFSDLRRSAQDFDVIHAFNSSTMIPLLTASALASGPSSSATTLIVSPVFHPHASNRVIGIIKPLFERTADRYVLHEARRIICVSETEAQLLRERFAVADKLTTIYPGVEVDNIQNATPYEFDGKLILYVGRLERYKNIHRVIEAVSHLPPCFAFYVIGKGPYKSELEALIRRYDLAGRVRLLGACDDVATYRWMKTSALVVNLSEVETFGITVLEALAAGKPALVNDALGLRELALRFRGAVVSIRADKINSRELARALEATARQSSQVDLSDFRWERIATQTLETYKDVERP